MAAASSTSEELPECPVCHEEFQDPKMLPCTHVLCKRCLLSWLQAEGAQAGCPLCRCQILSEDGQGQNNLERRVDALPTDLVLVSQLESSRVLESHGACAVCEEEEEQEEATSYCLQCQLKLCAGCARSHRRYPAFKGHEVKALGTLTPGRLSASHSTPCKAHPERAAEVFCPQHRQLLCLLCATTQHEACSGKTGVHEAAQVERGALSQRVAALRSQEAALAKRINEIRLDLQAKEEAVKETFDELEKAVENRRREIMSRLACVGRDTEQILTALEQKKALVTLHAKKAEQYTNDASDDVFLQLSKGASICSLKFWIKIYTGGELDGQD